MDKKINKALEEVKQIKEGKIEEKTWGQFKQELSLEKAIKYLDMMENKINFDLTGYIYGNEAIETVLEALENSIPKKKIEDEIKKLKEMNVGGEVFTTAVNFAIKILQELLEEI